MCWDDAIFISLIEDAVDIDPTLVSIIFAILLKIYTANEFTSEGRTYNGGHYIAKDFADNFSPEFTEFENESSSRCNKITNNVF